MPRQSERIRSKSYHPQTAESRLPRIISGVAEASCQRRRRNHAEREPMFAEDVEEVHLDTSTVEQIVMDGSITDHVIEDGSSVLSHPGDQITGQRGLGQLSRMPLFSAARLPVSDSLEPNDVGRMDVVCPFCCALHWFSERVLSSSKYRPEFETCCAHGKVTVPFLSVPPKPLYDFFVQDTIQAREFRDNIVHYNAALAFTSMGVNIDQSIIGRGPPVFRIHGELSHLSGSLLPEEGSSPIYSQLYICDDKTAFEQRVVRNPDQSLSTMSMLQNMMQNCNPYAGIYKHAYEVLRLYSSNNYYVKLCVRAGHSDRQHDLPSADEIGVVLPGENEGQTDYRDIVLHLRPEYYKSNSDHRWHVKLQRINEGHTSYAPLHFVILFPRGEPGWFQGLRSNKDNSKISLLQYTAFRLHSRYDEFSTILRGGRLFQRYLVDMFACIDQDRLHYIRTQQPKLRVTMLSGIEDALQASDDHLNVSDIGQRIVLPSSYRGGPRDMYQRFLDGMAVARHFKKVDIFLTMTANPNWPEITRELLPHQSASDRPELVTRVFRLKQKALLEAILNHGIFGPCVAYIYAIEFQKRGLPHMHLLIFLKSDYKLLAPEIVDTIISAEWPDPQAQPNLFNLVKRHMIHGPCGEINRNAPCMKNGKCSHGYPKPFEAQTTIDGNSYPRYRRRNDGRAYPVGKYWVDNRWIVPYNPFCILSYTCHINVECAVFFGSLKYINKYFNKGGDCGTVELSASNDEVKQYIDGRYFSASEAAWRIFQFPLHEQQPNVVRLPVHLPNDRRVVFNCQQSASEIIHDALQADTALTAFFEANRQDGETGETARRLTYQEFPEHFTLYSPPDNRRSRKWRLRKKAHLALGRMAYVGPAGGERFYLRTLLLVSRGAKSFDDLKSFQGHICESFQDACLKHGLLEDDGEWQLCLQDAADMQTGSQLRHLFASILLFCTPAQPHQLWSMFRQYICDDLQHQLHNMDHLSASEDDIYDYGLYLIDQILQNSGHCLSDFPSMPSPSSRWSEIMTNRFIAQQLDFNIAAEADEAETSFRSLNDDQRAAFTRIKNSVALNQGKLFFIDGYGGTGKTYLYESLCHAFRAQGLIVICVASTGLACLLLPGGQTAHSMFKIPIETLDAESICNIPKESLRADLIRATQVVIFDECLMTHRHCFEALDRTLQDIRNISRPFGGLTMVFGGDFQQILPVVSHGSRSDIVDASLCKSYLWRSMEILKLRINMRLQHSAEDMLFSQWLLDIGHGRTIDSEGCVEIPSSVATYDEDDLISKVYGDIQQLSPSSCLQYFLDHAILAPRNSDVDDTNEKILARMSGSNITYHSADSVESDSTSGILPSDLPPDFLHSLNIPSLPPSELKLKIGCPLMLLRNLDPGKGLCNGTRLLLDRVYPRVLEVTIIGGDHHGQKAFIPRISLKPTTQQYPFTLKRRQFPVRLAFAMTINKAQGQSLQYVGIHLRSSVFCHGQLYVALSRTTSSKRLSILLPDTPLGRQRKVLNVVYPEVIID